LWFYPEAVRDPLEKKTMAPWKRVGLIQVKLRISEDLKRRLDREARKREDGSLSAEIAERLERSFSEPALEQKLATTVERNAGQLKKEVATAVIDQLAAGGWIISNVISKKENTK
jgi:hypothetical protein